MTLASLNIQIQIFIHDSDIIEYSNTIFPFSFGEYMKNKYNIPDYSVGEYQGFKTISDSSVNIRNYNISEYQGFFKF